MEAQREMTLDELVAQLPEKHQAREELESLRETESIFEQAFQRLKECDVALRGPEEPGMIRDWATMPAEIQALREKNLNLRRQLRVLK